jgi:hypothetical protein
MMQPHVEAVARQTQRNRAPDTAAATGNQYSLFAHYLRQNE